MIGDGYLAGLWESNFLEQLVWFHRSASNDSLGIHTRSAEYRASSWSWIPIDGFVQPAHGLEASPLCTLLECKVEFVDPYDPFGMVSGGYIRIRGPLKQVPAHIHAQDDHLLTCPLGFRKTKVISCVFETDSCYLDDWATNVVETWNAAEGLYLLRVADDACLGKNDSIMLVPTRECSGVFRRRGDVTSGTHQQPWFDDAQMQTITII